MTIAAVATPGLNSPSQVGRDRLELMTALLHAPGCAPFYRADVITIPPEQALAWWRCEVDTCKGAAKADGLCIGHSAAWKACRATTTKAQFLSTTRLLGKFVTLPTVPCKVCPGRLAANRGLCSRHRHAWVRFQEKNPGATIEQWLPEQTPYPSLGTCTVSACIELAHSPQGLCVVHERRYHLAGSPGGARLPDYWFRRLEPKGLPIPLLVDDEVAYRRWCAVQDPIYRSGVLNLKAMHALTRAEIQWGMFTHAQKRHRTRWQLAALHRLAGHCRTLDAGSLFDLVDDPDRRRTFRNGANAQVRMMVREITDGLRSVYYSPQDSREAGFLETDHFGRRFRDARSRYDLTLIRQRWLRDMVWNHMAEMLSSPTCPRSRGPFDAYRRSAIELGAFLEIDAPDAGHDPTLLRAEHAERFVADHRRRAREGLPALGVHRLDGQLSPVTEITRRFTFNHLRPLMFRALENGGAERIGLHTSFATAFPPGGTDLKRSRPPFNDDIARALTDEDNLNRLAAEFDSFDRGIRDVWEAIVLTGRRSNEILRLRLDCLGRYGGLPVLWHDQTKVGRYDQAIRIPERLHQRLDARRVTTLARFEDRYAREPTPDERARMALFVTHIRNPTFERCISYTSFYQGFRGWVDSLELGPAVPHQARHTMATRLLDAGATLTHIRQFLGQVSDRMAEYYVHISDTSLDAVLQTIWVAGPGSQQPGALLSTNETPFTKAEATALALDLTHRSTPTEGGFCTFQPVVNGSDCPWKLNCEGCKHFVLSGADLLYWRRKQEQWRSIAERAPDDATADYLHQVFEPTAQAIRGLERALAGLGLLEQALNLDLRRPQDYYHRIWNTAFSAADLSRHADATHVPGGQAE